MKNRSSEVSSGELRDCFITFVVESVCDVVTFQQFSVMMLSKPFVAYFGANCCRYVILVAHFLFESHDCVIRHASHTGVFCMFWFVQSESYKVFV